MDPTLALLATVATIVSGLIALLQWFGTIRDSRRVERMLDSGSVDSADFTIPTLGRGPAVDLAQDYVQYRVVKFGVMPYADHSQAFIADRLGWFEEAGIRLVFREYTPATAFAALERGEVDVVSETPSGLIKRGANPEHIRAFVLHDLFVGYGLMTRRRIRMRPPFRVRSYAELRRAGHSHQKAIAGVANLLVDSTVAHSQDDAIMPFLERLVSCNDNTRNGFRSVVASEIDTVRLTVRRKADFQVGGVPTRLTLERLGFRALISSRELLLSGVLLQDSADYLGLIQCGWFCRKDWLDADEDLVMRLASVSYRTSRFIQENPALAARVHVDYLNKIADTQLSTMEITRAYTDLHPFKTFEEQSRWFTDVNDPFFVPLVTDKLLEHWRSRLKDATFDGLESHADVVVASRIHQAMRSKRRDCIERLDRVVQLPNSARRESTLKSSMKYFASYNYVDSLLLLDALIAAEGAEAAQV